MPLSFYRRDNVVQIAQELLGTILVSIQDNELVAGTIVETEAYGGASDRASHAWNNRRTARTEVMFQQGGVAYIYLIYGIHHLFNVVTGAEGEADAVLIRAVEPLIGKDVMAKRRKLPFHDKRLTRGPGALGQAFGFHYIQTGTSLLSDHLWISDATRDYEQDQILAAQRVGVDYAGSHAKRPWRFFVKGSDYVSRIPKFKSRKS